MTQTNQEGMVVVTEVEWQPVQEAICWMTAIQMNIPDYDRDEESLAKIKAKLDEAGKAEYTEIHSPPRRLLVTQEDYHAYVLPAIEASKKFVAYASYKYRIAR